MLINDIETKEKVYFKGNIQDKGAWSCTWSSFLCMKSIRSESKPRKENPRKSPSEPPTDPIIPTES